MKNKQPRGKTVHHGRKKCLKARIIKFEEIKEIRDAEYCLNEGEKFYKNKDFENAIEYYIKAASLEPNDASDFNYLQAKFAKLIQIKQNNVSFQEFNENIEKSAKKANFNQNLVEGGNRLCYLAKIKQDEMLFNEACKKYEEAIQVDQHNADIFYRWGIALSHLARIKQYDKLFKEAFEKYKKAANLKSNYTEVFNSWKIAFIILARTKQNEDLLMETCEEYIKLVGAYPNNYTALNGHGVALRYLAKIKQNEKLLDEAREKYKEATILEPSNYLAFNNWGYLLNGMAEDKHDEDLFKKSLFKEACEKSQKAAILNQNSVFAYNNWGIALAGLAQIKKSESLFKDACEKYKKAASSHSHYIDTFNNWGITLCFFAKLKKKCETLFLKELEAFKEKSKEINDSITLLIKGKLYFLLGKETEAVQYFTNSKKDILEIYTFLDKDNPEKIIRKILDEDDFFREVTKGMPEKKLNEYKKVYILSISIINQLHINNKNEKLIAYYTNKTISQKMLFNDNSKFRLNAINYSNDPTEGKALLDFLFGEEKCPTKKELNNGFRAFTGCFTFNYDSLNQFRLYGKDEGKEGTGLSLVFRDDFFNKEAKMAMKKNVGISVSPRKEDEKHALFRCMYIDTKMQEVVSVGYKEEDFLFKEKREEFEKDNKRKREQFEKDIKEKRERFEKYIEEQKEWFDIEKKRVWFEKDIKEKREDFEKYLKEERDEFEEKIKEDVKIYEKYIHHIIDSVKRQMKVLKEMVENLDPEIVRQLLVNLRYLTKHFAFKEEQECRIVKIHRLGDKKTKIHESDDFKRLYIEYEPKPSNHIKKIYFGPKVTETEMELFQDILTHKELNIPYEKSKNPLA